MNGRIEMPKKFIRGTSGDCEYHVPFTIKIQH